MFYYSYPMIYKEIEPANIQSGTKLAEFIGFSLGMLAITAIIASALTSSINYCSKTGFFYNEKKCAIQNLEEGFYGDISEDY